MNFLNSNAIFFLDCGKICGQTFALFLHSFAFICVSLCRVLRGPRVASPLSDVAHSTPPPPPPSGGGPLARNPALGFAAAKLLLPLVKDHKRIIELDVQGTSMAARQPRVGWEPPPT